LISLEDLRPERRPGEPTARELFAIMRRLADGEPYAEVMAGFSDFDYTRPDLGRRRRRRIPESEPHRWTSTEQLLREHATDPEMVNRVRERLVAAGQRYMEAHGYTSTEIAWSMNNPDDPMGLYVVRLEVYMEPRHDGEWDSIRAAIEEDEADRAEAVAGKTAVNDRLDALHRAAAAWSSSALRDTARSAERAATGFSAMGEALRKVDLRPSDRA
jgi:hypothetical protein